MPPTRLEKLFHDAVDMPPEERSAFLADACGNDRQLHEQVLALISASGQDTGFLEHPIMESTEASISQMLCALGEVLGHYKIIRLLGRGGMGDVYLATDNNLGRKVALKLLPFRMSAMKTILTRFWLEARTTSALNHPNIMTVYEIGDDNGLHYIAAEYVEGSTVRQLLAHGPMDTGQAVSIAIQAARGLAAAHSAGVIHRDIKPENIMVRPDGYVKILDFGLAKLTQIGTDRQAGLSSTQNTATVPGILLGTVGYMSPEQARGLDLDLRTDLFSLGAVLYEMVTGKCPFTGDTPSDALSSVLQQEMPPISVAVPSLSPELAAVMARLLAKDREKRYQIADEVVAALETVQQRLTLPQPPASSTNYDKEEPVAAPAPVPVHKSLFHRGAIISTTLILLGLATLVVMRAYIAGRNAQTPQRWSFNCRLRVQDSRSEAAKEITLPAAALLEFTAGQRIRFYFSSQEPGYLYILDQSIGTNRPPAEFVTLFPSPTANGGSSGIPASQQIAIPQESWLEFDQEKGTERLWMIWSGTKLPLLDGLARYANVKDRGRILSAADQQSISDFLQANYRADALELALPVIAVRGDSRMLVWRMDLEHK